MKKLLMGCLFIIVSLPSVAALIETRVDRSQIGMGEAFKVIFSINDSDLQKLPDLSPLNQYFSVLGTTRSSQVTILNGNAKTQTEWVVTLSARQPGHLIVPSLDFGSRKSESVRIQVLSQREMRRQGQVPEVYLEGTIDKANPYVQAQVQYVLKLYFSTRLTHGRLQAPKINNAIVEPMGQDKRYQTQRDGHLYQVLERRYAIFPQQSGRLSIPRATFTGMKNNSVHRNGLDPFAGYTTQPVRVHSAPYTLDVAAIPKNYPANDWLPSKRVTVTEKWSASKGKVGEVLTRKVSLSALGLTSAQLPDLQFTGTDSFNVYVNNQSRIDMPDDAGLLGQRIWELTYIPTSGGSIEIPPIKLAWWNVNKNKLAFARLPRTSLIIDGPVVQQKTTPKPAAPQQSAPKDNPTTTSPSLPMPDVLQVETKLSEINNFRWLLYTLILLLLGLCVGMAVYVWHLPSVRLFLACRSNNPQDARLALIAWSSQHWPEESVQDLSVLISRLAPSPLQAALQALNQRLYSKPKKPWTGDALWQAFKQRSRYWLQAAPTIKRVLPPLYLGKY